MKKKPYPSLVCLFVSSWLLFPGVDVGTRFESFLRANCGAGSIHRCCAAAHSGFAAQSKASSSCSSFLRLAALFTKVMAAGGGAEGWKVLDILLGLLIALATGYFITRGDIMLGELHSSCDEAETQFSVQAWSFSYNLMPSHSQILSLSLTHGSTIRLQIYRSKSEKAKECKCTFPALCGVAAWWS